MKKFLNCKFLSTEIGAVSKFEAFQQRIEAASFITEIEKFYLQNILKF